jgi:hypothetical protein
MRAYRRSLGNGIAPALFRSKYQLWPSAAHHTVTVGVFLDVQRPRLSTLRVQCVVGCEVDYRH